MASPAVDMPLTLRPSQQRFVEAYVANGGNGTQAWIDAGYAPANARQAASRALQSPSMRKAILAHVSKVQSAAEFLYPKSALTAARYESELASIGFDSAQRARDRIQAIAVAAKIGGHLVDKHEIVVSDAVKQLAERDGIDLEAIEAEYRVLDAELGALK